MIALMLSPMLIPFFTNVGAVGAYMHTVGGAWEKTWELIVNTVGAVGAAWELV
jgi:hypothetical protein